MIKIKNLKIKLKKMKTYNTYTTPSSSTINYKSNMDRINKINSKLATIQNTLSQQSPISYNNNYPNANPISNIEERLTSLDQKNFESQEIIFQELSKIKKDLANLLHEIELERQNYLKYFFQRKNFIENFEKKLTQKITQEQKERIDMEERLISKIDKNANTLRNQLNRENKEKENDIKLFGNFLENEMPKIIKEMKQESDERLNSDMGLSKFIDDEFTNLYNIINEEKLNRENTENSLIDMIKGITARIKVDIENEKTIREANEKNLIVILEQTIQKLNFPSN